MAEDMIEKRAFNKARPGDDVAVFMSYVEFEPNSGCWLWSGPLGGKLGYGRFYRNGRQHMAHRWLYEQTRGSFGDLMALHRCDTPCCVNPSHIFAGTNDENVADRDAKCRQAKGERNGQARLTASEADAIRRSGATSTVLAAEYGVHPATVKRIKNGERWRDQ